MLVDAIIEHATRGKARYDRDAKIAMGGDIIPELLASLMSEPYLRKTPPKTAGREQFGRDYAEKCIAWGKKHRAAHEDLVRTVTVFTSLSIADAFRRVIFPRARIDQLIVAGGGAQNPLDDGAASRSCSPALKSSLPPNGVSRPKQKKHSHSPFWPTKHFTIVPITCLPRQALSAASVMGKLVRGHER